MKFLTVKCGRKIQWQLEGLTDSEMVLFSVYGFGVVVVVVVFVSLLWSIIWIYVGWPRDSLNV